MRKPCTHYLRYFKRGDKWIYDREVSPSIMARMREHYVFTGQPTTIQYRKVRH